MSSQSNRAEARQAEETSRNLRNSVDNLNALASEADQGGDQHTAQQHRGGMTSAAIAYLESIGAIEPQS